MRALKGCIVLLLVAALMPVRAHSTHQGLVDISTGPGAAMQVTVALPVRALDAALFLDSNLDGVLPSGEVPHWRGRA